MAKRYEIYKCEECGNVVEVIEGGEGALICCSSEMVLQKENSVDAAKEKHVPVIEQTKDGYIVSIGSVEHPMTAEHYITLIELCVDDNCYSKSLNPSDKPAYEFIVKAGSKVKARAYCNLHGLWVS